MREFFFNNKKKRHMHAISEGIFLTPAGFNLDLLSRCWKPCCGYIGSCLGYSLEVEQKSYRTKGYGVLEGVRRTAFIYEWSGEE